MITVTTGLGKRCRGPTRRALSATQGHAKRLFAGHGAGRLPSRLTVVDKSGKEHGGRGSRQEGDKQRRDAFWEQLFVITVIVTISSGPRRAFF